MGFHISVDGVTKRFDHGASMVTALDDVSLDVRRGEFVAILGPSGCGKSTLLRLVSGLDFPSRGSILLDGKPVAGPGPHVGYVFQQPMLMPWLSTLENVLLPSDLMKRDRATALVRARHLLERAGLKGWEDARVQTLSGGMQQRTAICRALLTSPSVLLMDEPFAAVDAMTREDLCSGLLDIWRVEQKTILFVTHNITEAVYLADRIVVMTGHPGGIAEVVGNPLPRPRQPGVEFTPAFGEVATRLRAAVYAARTNAAQSAPALA